MKYSEETISEEQVMDWIYFIRDEEKYRNDTIKKIKELERRFVEGVLINESGWVKERRTAYLNSELKTIRNKIGEISKKIEKVKMVDWLVEYLYEAELKKLFGKKRKYSQEVFRWNHPHIDNAGEITKEDIERARDVPIEDIVGDKPTMIGNNKKFYKAPWRDETKASMAVYTKTNSFYDYGQSFGGDSIDFVMKLYAMTFVEAVKFLIKK